MGRLLDALRADSENAPAAKVANVANVAPPLPERLADSQDSQRLAASNHGLATDTNGTRDKLLTLAAQEQVAARSVHRLPDDELAACTDCTDYELRAYLLARVQSELMDAGQVPPGYTVAATCEGCGTVWLWPGAPANVKACPWCFRRKAGKPFPRPPA
jgi:hypothetical protein